MPWPDIAGVIRVENAPAPGTSDSYSTPAPIGGLNSQDPISAMPEQDAVVLENWFPMPTYVAIRNGYTNWVTGLPGWCETLMAYGGLSRRQLWGIVWDTTNNYGAIYNCTTQGAAPAATITGLSNARFEYCNFGTPGGEYLVAANAADSVQLYNGTTWQAVTGVSTPIAITGVTTSTLRNPVGWKNRLWFVQDGSMNVWYLPTQQIGGAAQSIALGSIFKLGGSIQSIVTATVDSASIIDDYIGFLTTEGELALYRGTDPAQAGLFNLVGVFRIGRPVGRRPWFKLGGDTVFLTSDGYSLLSKLIQVGEDNQADALSWKIQNLVNIDVQAYFGNFGWQGTVYPLGNKVIINVPVQERPTYSTATYQYVMNTITNAWTKYTGWLASTFEVMGNQLFFGSQGYVALADYGFNDNGATIVAKLKPAFSYFGTHNVKQFNMVRPVFQVNGSITPLISLNVDFQDNPPQGNPLSLSSAGEPWNVGAWNTSPWGLGDVIQRNWMSIPGTGNAASAYLIASTNSAFVRLASFDWVFEQGGLF